MDAGEWEDLYRDVQGPEPEPVVTGFNANIDRIIPVTASLLSSLEKEAGAGFAVLRERLLHSMRYCTADELFISSRDGFSRFLEFFADQGSLALGGQAAIAAIQLHRIGMAPVTCVVPSAGPQLQKMLITAGIRPVSFGPGTAEYPDIVHLILEHRPGLVSPAEGVVPRSNRFIVSPVHDPSAAFVPAESEDFFLEQVAACSRAFLSGYQYLRTESDFAEAAGQLRRIRTVHSRMRTHVECVSGLQPEILSLMLRYILPATDSIGLNEHELGMYSRILGGPERSPPEDMPANVESLVNEAVALARSTGAARVHVHTYGFYLAILDPGVARPERSRDALVFAAREAAAAAGGGQVALSPEGLRAYEHIRTVLGPGEIPGVFRAGDRVVVVVPTPIAPHVRRTVGLGDILSSTAFVADPF